MSRSCRPILRTNWADVLADHEGVDLVLRQVGDVAREMRPPSRSATEERMSSTQNRMTLFLREEATNHVGAATSEDFDRQVRVQENHFSGFQKALAWVPILGLGVTPAGWQTSEHDSASRGLDDDTPREVLTLEGDPLDVHFHLQRRGLRRLAGEIVRNADVSGCSDPQTTGSKKSHERRGRDDFAGTGHAEPNGSA